MRPPICGTANATAQVGREKKNLAIPAWEGIVCPAMPFGLDILVVLAYFGIVLGIGLSQRAKSGSVEGFTLGNRQMPWWAVLASIIAAEISAAGFLGTPGEGFESRNWTYVQLAIGTILARILVSVLFIPLYYKHGVISIYEFLQTRFGPLTRKGASITFMITRVLAMGTRLYVSAIIVVLAFELLAGRAVAPMEKFWLFAVALTLVSLLTAVYTSVGGIRAVIWTDLIQVGVLVAALGFSAAFLLSRIDGGWAAVSGHIQPPVFADWGAPQGSLDLVYILTHEYTMWAACIASVFVNMATHGIDQDTVQRMLTAKNRRQSAFATIMSGLVDVPIVGAFVFVGLLLSLYYQQNPDPLAPLTKSREMFPYFILHVMPAGLRGLVTAGILAATMGSLSTALNALATSFSRDFILPRLGPGASDRLKVWILRWSTVGFAVSIIGVGVITAWYVTWHPEVRIIPLVLGIMGYTFGSILGIFLVALFTKTRGNDAGNLLAMVSGFLAVLWFSVPEVQSTLGVASPFIIAFPWRITLGTLVTAGVALCFRTKPGKTGA